jgi:drug/metabolite transporter (DMT)-like permease
VLVVAHIVLKERVTFLKTTGIILGFAGAAVLMLNSRFSSSSGLDNPFGDLLVFISASAWGVYLVLVKPLMQKYHTVTILKWVFTFGFVLVLPFGYKELKEVDWDSFSSTVWLYMLFIIVANTFLAYLLNVYALNALSPSVVSTYIYLQPLLTAVLAIAMGQDAINVMKIISALLIFAGVYLASRRARLEN